MVPNRRFTLLARKDRTPSRACPVTSRSASVTDGCWSNGPRTGTEAGNQSESDDGPDEADDSDDDDELELSDELLELLELSDEELDEDVDELLELRESLR